MDNQMPNSNGNPYGNGGQNQNHNPYQGTPQQKNHDSGVKNVFMSVLPSLGLIALQTYVVLVGCYWLVCYHAKEYTSGTMADFMTQAMEGTTSTTFMTVVMMVYTIVGCILYGLWYKKMDATSKRKRYTSFGNKPAYFVAGVVLLSIGLQLVSSFIITIISLVDPVLIMEYEDMIISAGLTDITIPMVIYAAILGPICEELAFRGLTYGYARRNLGFWATNIVQALFFAGIHMNIVQGLYAFVLGLVLGYFREKTGKLSVTIALHICFNTIGTIGSALMPSGPSQAVFFLTLFGTMVACYVGFMLLDRSIEKPEAEAQQAEGSKLN